MKTVFIDRDGVICHNRHDYVKAWTEFEFLPGALEALAELTRGGYRIVAITNQAGIAREMVTRGAVEEINHRMIEEAARWGGEIEAVLYCPHRPEDGCNCRKPRPGLLYQARDTLGVDLSQAYLIGDHLDDIDTAQAAGIRATLVLSGRGLRAFLSREARRRKGYRVALDLRHAVRQLLRDGGT